jgi:predicted dithiol-disulfide oxidoreductase (DUF899 family)
MSTNANVSEPKTRGRERKIVSQKEWLVARKGLLEAEKELTRRSDELARRRQELPWVRVGKAYRFETDEGSASLADRTLSKTLCQKFVSFEFGFEALLESVG